MFKDRPWGPGANRAGTTTTWDSQAEKAQFEKMMADPVHRKYFVEKGWDDPEAITYSINSYGFRCEEFDDTPCIVTLGCSFTSGVGLPLQNIWPTLVGNALGLKVVNLAWGGQGSDYCFRMAEYWLPRLPVKRCVLLNPPASRIEVLLEDNTAETFMVNTMSGYYNPNDWFLNQWLMNEENQRLNNLKNSLAIKQLCLDLNIPCQTFEAHEHMSGSREDLEYARDYLHAGPKGHVLLAERILNEH